MRHPTDAVDFSSYLLQAQGSGADIIALANTGGDAINALKQAREFGMIGGNQTFAGMLMFLSDIHSTGLETAQGLLLTTGFYWDRNDQTRAFAERFAALNHGRKPTMNQAGAYSATLAYLDAVVKVGSPEDGAAVVRAMRQRETFEDPLFGKTFLREDGRVLHDMLLVQVKSLKNPANPMTITKSSRFYLATRLSVLSRRAGVNWSNDRWYRLRRCAFIKGRGVVWPSMRYSFK